MEKTFDLFDIQARLDNKFQIDRGTLKLFPGQETIAKKAYKQYFKNVSIRNGKLYYSCPKKIKFDSN